MFYFNVKGQHIYGNSPKMMVDDLMKYLARMVKDGDRFHGNQQICIMTPSGNYSYPKIEIEKTVNVTLN